MSTNAYTSCKSEPLSPSSATDIYDPIRKELESQGLLLCDDALPRIYSVIKEEVLKQEAMMPQAQPKLACAESVVLDHQKQQISSTPTWYSHQGQLMPNFQPDLSYIPYYYKPGQPPCFAFPTTTSPLPINGNTGIPPAMIPSNYHPISTNTDHFEDQTSSNYGKIKRVRTDFSQVHLDRLEVAFSKSHYTRGTERDDLARQLKVTPKSVTIWFQNRRAKLRSEQRQDSFIKKAAETGNSKVDKIRDFR